MGEVELDRKALEDFIVNNLDRERLEALLNRFNIFEATGFVRQETRHSDFLAFLLNPRETHGLNDAFVKRLLQRAVMDSPNASAPVTPIELSLWDLGKMEVRREWQHIDIFLLDEREELAVIIENKIRAGEHGDQLDRYYEAVREQYPDYRLLALYLTPGGDEPSHPEYLPVDYRAVCEILDELAESRASTLEPDAKVLIEHYTEMLRRHIVGDSEIARLSRQIYRKHQRAIDLILEYRPDTQAEIQETLERLIGNEPRFELDPGTAKSKIKFGVREWDTSALLTSSGWTASKRILLFEVWNDPGDLRMKLYVGPGNQDVRQKLIGVVRDKPEIFRGAARKLGAKWSNIFSRSFLEQQMYEEADQEERNQEIRKQWADFLENDLPRIEAALKQERWIWESSDNEVKDVPGRSERFVWSDGDIEIKRPGEDSEQGED